MNDEIREILDNMFHIIMKYEEDFEDLEENEIRYQLPYNKMQKLYDYITNLQNENQRLKEDKKKAADYVKEHIRIDDEYPAYMEMLIEERDNLLNILQNGSERDG